MRKKYHPSMWWYHHQLSHRVLNFSESISLFVKWGFPSLHDVTVCKISEERMCLQTRNGFNITRCFPEPSRRATLYTGGGSVVTWSVVQDGCRRTFIHGSWDHMVRRKSNMLLRMMSEANLRLVGNPSGHSFSEKETCRRDLGQS